MGVREEGSLDLLGRCADNGEVLIEAEDLAELLALARNPPDPGLVGRPPTMKETADLDHAADRLFLNLTAEEQALYLSRVSADEAATDLEKLMPSRRAIVFDLLPQIQRQAVAHNWDRDGKVLSD